MILFAYHSMVCGGHQTEACMLQAILYVGAAAIAWCLAVLQPYLAIVWYMGLQP